MKRHRLNARKGMYRVAYLIRGRKTLVPATLQFDAATNQMSWLKRRGLTAWVEDEAGEFIPVEGAMRKPRELP